MSDFQLIDEVRDCITLFEKLNDTLTASWDLMYEKAKDYYARNGNLEVPYKYKTADGYSLGHWILTQKRVRTGDTPGILSAERIAKLDEIGMVWSGYRDLAWERNFEAAKEYYATFGNLNVVARYVTKTGLNLGAWIARLRILRKNQSQQRYLTPERIQALDEIGMVWDVADHLWQQYYGACLTYYHAHGNLNIPAEYITADGLRLAYGLIPSAALIRESGRTTDCCRSRSMRWMSWGWSGTNEEIACGKKDTRKHWSTAEQMEI